MADVPEKKPPVLYVDSAMVQRPKRGSATVLANGWLKAPATLARTGVFEYTQSDGSKKRMLRMPEEVFAQDALDSMQMLPITDGHPSRPLDAASTKGLQVGQVGDGVHQDGKFVRANVLITDAKLVQQVLSGAKVQLSCGYFSEDDETPGEYQGMKYDSIQRNIRANHVALCVEGRAGPDVRIKLDTAPDSVIFLDGPSEEIANVVKFTIDSVDFEVSEPVAQALAKSDEIVARELNALKGALTTATAKYDSLGAEMKQVSAALAAATDPSAIRTKISARVDLEKTASKFIKDAKFETLSDLDIKRSVVESIRGEKLSRDDAPYIEAAFDFALTVKPAAAHTAGYVAAVDMKMDSKPTSSDVRRAYIKASEESYKNLK